MNNEVMQPAVSVVVPVYNAEAYLKECIESFLGQTFQNFELICVDDGSTDSSMDILQKYAEADSRIHILHQKNAGAGVARNRGLSVAQGKYLVFLDADDFFESTLLEKTYHEAVSSDADIVLFGADKFNTVTGLIEDASWYFNRKYLPESKVFSRKDTPDKIMTITSPAPWTKLFSREFVQREKLEFQALQNSNDIYFSLVAMCLADRITYVDENLVHYRVGQISNIQSNKNKHPLCFIQAYTAVYETLKDRGIFSEVEKSYVDVVISGCAMNLNTITDTPSRLKIYEALSGDAFNASGILEHPVSYYADKNKFYQVNGCLYAWDQHQKIIRRQVPQGAKLIVQGKNIVQPKVSVIIPVYNVEQYLRECLNSIISQTLKEIEIICINDGSPDNSLNILKSYAETDSRICVYTQENGGLSYTRNNGVKVAHGKYIYFMDSDDILDIHALEHLYQYAENEQLDAVYFDGSSFGDEVRKDQIERYQDYYHRKGDYHFVQSGLSLMDHLLENNEYRTSPCLQFLTKEHFINHALWFQEGILHEDNLFTFKGMLSAKRVSHLGEILFFRRIRPDSIMTIKATFSHAYGYFSSYVGMNRYLNTLNLSEEQMKAPAELLYRALHNARAQFSKLDEDEKYAFLGLPIMQQTTFKLYVWDVDRKVMETKNLRSALQKAYIQKSEINHRLQQTYQEKSEINRKLQITYREKAERGTEIKRLKGELQMLQKGVSAKDALFITKLKIKFKQFFTRFAKKIKRFF